MTRPAGQTGPSGLSARCPAVLVAAPASGQGKTTVTAALACMHTRQGRRVRVFKCGPDFLNPFWLALASGAPVHQVDLWMTGEADALAATPLGRMELAQMQATWSVDFSKKKRSFALDGIEKSATQSVDLQGLHARTLSANHALRDALRAHAAAGKPVWAECGGMMLLFDTLIDKTGASHPMWGLLPGQVRMQPRLAALGPVRASYFHAWFTSAPAAVAALFSPIAP